MKAGVLAINLGIKCNAACPFCISRMTYKTTNNNQLIMDNLGKAVRYSLFHGVDTAMITGIGEPMLFPELPQLIGELKSLGMPVVELQTNGTLLTNEICEELKGYGLDVISVSFSSLDNLRNAWIMKYPLYNISQLMRGIKQSGLLSRLSLNVNPYVLALPDDDIEKLISSPYTELVSSPYTGIREAIKDFIDNSLVPFLNSGVIHQLTLRKLGIPSTGAVSNEYNSDSQSACQWALRHEKASEIIMEELKNNIICGMHGNLLRTLPYGAQVYDYNGIGVCFTTCITNTPDPELIRNFILQPDGHIYHSWDMQGSILV